MQPVYIVDLFDTIVSKVGCKYIYGHPLEINEQLVLMSKSASVTAFPIIALLMDFPGDKGSELGTYADVDLHFLIAQQTLQNLTAPERYAQTFKPTLYPLYLKFLEQIAKSKKFRETLADLIRHTKIDRVYWGKEGIHGNSGLIFTDRLDVIEIKNLKLRVKPQIC